VSFAASSMIEFGRRNRCFGSFPAGLSTESRALDSPDRREGRLLTTESSQPASRNVAEGECGRVGLLRVALSCGCFASREFHTPV